ncbi:MAG: metallophosphoesterase [Pseudobutyrivibrio sp.]|nr:metallophosphoesterase [Pseudobutyrivibrio sp.]
MTDLTRINNSPNYKWIYTYDYPPDSAWQPWRDNIETPKWILDETKSVAERLRPNLLSYLLLSDSHFAYNGTWDDTIISMKMLADFHNISGIIHLGDLTDGLLPADETKNITEKIISDMKTVNPDIYLVPGNHDYNYFRGNADIFYPEKSQYYIDEPMNKLRLIFIDSFDPKEQIRYGFTDYCIHWLDAVFNLMPKDYKAIIFSHVPPLVRLQVWTDNIRNRQKLFTVLDKYAGNILAFIHGHSHCDILFNDLKNEQFPIIGINCAKCEYFLDYKPEGAVVPYRHLGNRRRESFDVMQVDVKNAEVYFSRFGAGSDRKVENGKAVFIEREEYK